MTKKNRATRVVVPKSARNRLPKELTFQKEIKQVRKEVDNTMKAVSKMGRKEKNPYAIGVDLFS